MRDKDPLLQGKTPAENAIDAGIEVVDGEVVKDGQTTGIESSEGLAELSILRSEGLPVYQNTLLQISFGDMLQETQRQLPYASKGLQMLLAEIWYIAPVYTAELPSFDSEPMITSPEWYEEPLRRHYSTTQDVADTLGEEHLAAYGIKDESDVNLENILISEIIKPYLSMSLQGIQGLLDKPDLATSSVDVGLIREYFFALQGKLDYIDLRRGDHHHSAPDLGLPQTILTMLTDRVRLLTLEEGFDTDQDNNLSPGARYFDLPVGSVLLYQADILVAGLYDRYPYTPPVNNSLEVNTPQDLLESLQRGETIEWPENLRVVVDSFLEIASNLLAEQDERASIDDRASAVMARLGSFNIANIEPIVIKAMSGDLGRMVAAIDRHQQLIQNSGTMSGIVKRELEKTIYNEIAFAFAQKAAEMEKVSKVSESLGEITAALALVLEHTDFELISTANLLRLSQDMGKIQKVISDNKIKRALYGNLVEYLNSQGIDACISVRAGDETKIDGIAIKGRPLYPKRQPGLPSHDSYEHLNNAVEVLRVYFENEQFEAMTPDIALDPTMGRIRVSIKAD